MKKKLKNSEKKNWKITIEASKEFQAKNGGSLPTAFELSRLVMCDTTTIYNRQRGLVEEGIEIIRKLEPEEIDRRKSKKYV